MSQIFPTAFSTKWHTFLQALERPGRYTLGLEILPWAKDCTLEIKLDLETMQEVMGGHRQLLVKIPSLRWTLGFHNGPFLPQVSGNPCNVHLNYLININS